MHFFVAILTQFFKCSVCPGNEGPGQDSELRQDIRGRGAFCQAPPDAVQPQPLRDGGRSPGQAHVPADQGLQGSHSQQERPLGV